MQNRSLRIRLMLIAFLAGGLANGCRFIGDRPAEAPLPSAPAGPPLAPIASEQNKVSLPPYIIEPPDILEVDAIKVVPKAPYKIEALDYLGINVNGTLRDEPITGTYAVEPGGTVNLGPAYGRAKVEGLTLEEAAEAIYRVLSRVLKQPEVSVTLAASSGQQQIAGEHRVGPDGTVNLGTYGTVYVTGMTVEEAKKAIETHLAEFLDTPEVSVDVFNYASKVYYIVGQGAGFGDSLVRVQITGNETVLDAISQTGGLTRLASKKIWIARPAPGGAGCDQILPVHWDEITRGASTATNYQILPGDRIYISEDKLIALDSMMGKIISPFERLFGFTTLGVQTVEEVKHPGLSNNGGVF
ncbi:MAG TPA: polysaccharide biosynthesis/export family protein [Pirellulales bacterium]|jgi:protein involved in polysaccharide export with SLBB domain|nr:polysaccharide biosynthesis/export family protein [Pirellulales bacterium]